MLLFFIFIPLTNLLFLCWQYITWARQKIINTRYISSELSLIYIFLTNIALFDSFFYTLSPIVLQVVIKVYLSFWIIIFNFTVSLLFIYSHYSFTFTIDYYIIEVVNIRLNCLSWFMVVVIILVSSCVLLCSIDYLCIIDSYLFLIYLSFFQLIMIIFVLSNSFIIIVFNWDWLGLISYLLINFWSSKTKSGIKAVVYNKVGDIGLIIVLCLSYSLMPFINYSPFLPYILIIFNFLVFNVNGLSSLYFAFFLCIALFTKSSQLPWSSWLILAMAAPTPTSALLHSSTMVIAGVYLGLIMQPLFILVFSYLSFIVILFLFTPLLSLLWSVFKAIFLSDIKSIIAFSTISQISYMFIAMFCSLPFICFFHIIIHALFKSLLFLLSGSFIHVQSSFQSIYKLKIYHSFINIIFILASSVLVISLSKEGIIYSTTFQIASSFFAMVVVLGGIFTMIYTLKIYNLIISSSTLTSFIFIPLSLPFNFNITYLLLFNYTFFLSVYSSLSVSSQGLSIIYSPCLSFLLPWLTISSIFIDQSLEYIFFGSCSLIYYSIDFNLVLSINCIMDYSLVFIVIIISTYLSLLLCIYYFNFSFNLIYHFKFLCSCFNINLFWSFNFYSLYYSCIVFNSSLTTWLFNSTYFYLIYYFSTINYYIFYSSYFSKSIIKLRYAMLCYFYFFYTYIFTSSSTFLVLSFNYFFFIYSSFFFKYFICLIEVYTGLSSFYSLFFSSFYLVVFLILTVLILIYT